MRGLFQEAIAKDDAELKQVLEEYDTILTNDPGNMVSSLMNSPLELLLTSVACIETLASPFSGL